MNVLVTGAAGFLGGRLITALLADSTARAVSLRIVAADLAQCPIDDPRVVPRTGNIAAQSFIDAIVEKDTDVVYHLAAVLSGQSEAEFDVGMRTNVDATRALLDACARLPTPPRFVFSSSIAVFGGPLPAVVPDDMALRPQSSYGTEKAIGELMVGDYSRRKWIDGVSCRRDPARPAEFRLVILRQRHRPRAAGRDRLRVPGPAGDEDVDHVAGHRHAKFAPRSADTHGGSRRPTIVQSSGTDRDTGSDAGQPGTPGGLGRPIARALGSGRSHDARGEHVAGGI
jgi:hypothetical protein